MYTLAIEAANKSMSVALLSGGQVVAIEGQENTLQHSVTLAPALERVMNQAQVKPADLGRIVVSNGPGSYTGLRIGVTLAKTLAYTLDIPLIPVPTLAVLAKEASDKKPLKGALYVPFFDARRQNVYVGFYDADGRSVLPDQHLAFAELLAILETRSEPLIFVSPDLNLYAESLTGFEQVCLYPSAESLGVLADAYPAVDAHLLRPNYLKMAEAEEQWQAKNPNQDQQVWVERQGQ